jgi:hypothetical protein
VLHYKPAAFRSHVLPPALGQAALGRPILGQTFDELLGFTPAMGDVIRLMFHSASAYLAMYVALKETGPVKYLGWVMGIGQGIGAVCDGISLAKRAAGIHPPEGAPTPVCDYVAPTALPMAPRVSGIPVRNL